MSRPHLFLLAVYYALLSSPLMAPAKDKDPLAKLTPPPPIALGQQVSSYAGHSIDIPLKAIWRMPTQVRFIIRTQPKHGVLGDVRITSPNTAVVTYTHNGQDGAGLDSFTFAAQGLGTPVSAAGKVSVVISEEPSSLEVPVEVDFGTVLIGDSVTKAITLENTGGGSIAGTLETPPAWKVKGSANYRVIHGQSETVQLTFTPTDDRNYTEKLRFSHLYTLSISLLGRGQAPLTFQPDGTIELGGAPVRSGTIIAHNATGQERVLSITAPKNVTTPKSVKIPAGDDVPIILSTDEKFKSGLEGQITFRSGTYEHNVGVRLFSMAPVLKAQPAEGFRFGTVESGSHQRRTLQLSNEGGTDARLRIDTPKFLLVTPDPATAVLAPGETRTFEISIDPQGSGPYAEKLIISGGSGDPLTLPVTAEVKRTAPAIVQEVDAGTKIPTDILAPIPTMPDTGEPRAIYNDIPQIKDVRLLRTAPNSVQLIWKKPAKNAVDYRIESRSLEGAGTGALRTHWEPWPAVSYHEENGWVTADISNLRPNSLQFMRIISLDGMENGSQPSPTLRINSSPAPDYHLRFALAVIIGLALVAFLVRRLYFNRQSNRSADDARIAKLG